MKSKPVSGVEKGKTSLYTLVVKKDQSYQIFVNQVSVTKGSLLEDFEPAVNPSKTIDDPSDSKPEDWEDEAKIDDPDATKPDDWDESAPRKIIDPSATIPADWLVDAPATIPDPESEKPMDWDDEEDGGWVAPSIPNPECEAAPGCGPWNAPMITNPAYVGKWTVPKIDNPAYTGVWAPKTIKNPDYFEDKTPSDFNKIGAVGFEIWSMQDGLLFDNIYIGHSVEDAEKLAKETWVVKAALEKAAEPETVDDGENPVLSENEYIARLQLLWVEIKRALVSYQGEALEFIDIAKHDPIMAIKELPHVLLVMVVITIFITMIPFFIFGVFTTAKPKAAKKKVAETKTAEKKAVETKISEKKPKVGEEATETKEKAKNSKKDE